MHDENATIFFRQIDQGRLVAFRGWRLFIQLHIYYFLVRYKENFDNGLLGTISKRLMLSATGAFSAAMVFSSFVLLIKQGNFTVANFYNNSKEFIKIVLNALLGPSGTLLIAEVIATLVIFFIFLHFVLILLYFSIKVYRQANITYMLEYMQKNDIPFFSNQSSLSTSVYSCIEALKSTDPSMVFQDDIEPIA